MRARRDIRFTIYDANIRKVKSSFKANADIMDNDLVFGMKAGKGDILLQEITNREEDHTSFYVSAMTDRGECRTLALGCIEDEFFIVDPDFKELADHIKTKEEAVQRAAEFIRAGKGLLDDGSSPVIEPIKRRLE